LLNFVDKQGAFLNKSELNDLNLIRSDKLLTPAELIAKLPITSVIEQTVINGRNQIRKILDGEDSRFIMLVGPCSIHDEKAALEYAIKLKEISDPFKDKFLTIMRVYFEKPRTTVGWTGFLYDPNLDDSFNMAQGLFKGRKLLLDLANKGIYCATEILDPFVPQYIADLISWAAIGARTVESQTHRQLASGLSMPVGMKNGTGGSTQVAIDAMIAARAEHGFLGINYDGQPSLVRTRGNNYVHLVLRGGNKAPNFDHESVVKTLANLENSKLKPQVLIDCSHANCEKDHEKMNIAFRSAIQQRSEGNLGIIGAMLESNLVAGKQNLDQSNINLEYGKSITDPCIDLDETRSLLLWAYNNLD
tara:strand:- start:6636 stop:7718 length:1083 start_codon:yes stop_codon:yes gene_type:complete